MLQKILDDFSTTDGNSIDNTKLFDSFNAAEKNSINVMDEINQGNEAAAIFTASTIYQGEGGSLWGFIKGVAANPSVIFLTFSSEKKCTIKPSFSYRSSPTYVPFL